MPWLPPSAASRVEDASRSIISFSSTPKLLSKQGSRIARRIRTERTDREAVARPFFSSVSYHTQPLIREPARRSMPFCNSDSLPAVAQATIAHAQFETMPPFATATAEPAALRPAFCLRRRGLSQRVSHGIAGPRQPGADCVARLTHDSLSSSRRIRGAWGVTFWLRIFAGSYQSGIVDADLPWSRAPADSDRVAEAPRPSSRRFVRRPASFAPWRADRHRQRGRTDRSSLRNQ